MQQLIRGYQLKAVTEDDLNELQAAQSQFSRRARRIGTDERLVTVTRVQFCNCGVVPCGDPNNLTCCCTHNKNTACLRQCNCQCQQREQRERAVMDMVIADFRD